MRESVKADGNNADPPSCALSRYCEETAAKYHFHTLVDDARVELDNDGIANDVAEEAGGVLALALRAVLHGLMLEGLCFWWVLSGVLK